MTKDNPYKPFYGVMAQSPSPVRVFNTGANRSSDTGKYDYEGFISPAVLEAFGAYMHKNRHLTDGSLRDSDNWQKGIPLAQYMKSLLRHVLDVWKAHRGYKTKESMLTNLLAAYFNTQGYLHEYLKANPDALQKEFPSE